MTPDLSRQDYVSVLDSAFGAGSDHRTLLETVTARIRELIVQGNLPANLPLRPQALASRLSVSVMPVREALRLLEAEGLVSFTPRRGARVAELSEEDIEETYIVRAALEGLAARLAVQNMTARDLRLMQRTYERMQKARQEQDLARFMTSDREFHAIMYGLSGREGLVHRILQLWDRSRRYLAVTYQTANPWDDALASHEAILRACQAHDAAQAERVTREHTEAACNRLLQALRTRARSGAAPPHRARPTIPPHADRK